MKSHFCGIFCLMIEKDIVIAPGMVVLHDEGLTYQVDDVRRSTRDYELTHELGGMTVNYTQLENGGFPAGTKWNKDEEGFREHFTLVEQSSEQ